MPSGDDTNATALERLVYEYNANNLLETVTMYRRDELGMDPEALLPVRRASYTYYEPDEDFGNPGDLKTVIIEQPEDPTAMTLTWFEVDRKTYRYDGLSRLTMVLEGASYERAVGDSLDVLTATSSALAPYANFVFDFYALDDSDPLLRNKVKSQTIQGLGTFTYEYVANSQKSGVNVWQTQTLEYLPDSTPGSLADNDVVVIYSNHMHETLASIFVPAGEAEADGWANAFQYDPDGRLKLAALPSAVDSIDSMDPHPMTLKSSDGLVHKYVYHPSGSATGYLQHVIRAKGETDTGHRQQSYTYLQRPNSDAHVLETLTEYRDDGNSAPIVTTYGYVFWNAEANDRIETRTTILPDVSDTVQNGAGDTDTPEVEEFDAYGRLVRFTDGDGKVMEMGYVDSTGALLGTIMDVGTLDLTTLYGSDLLGRITSITDPNGNVTGISFIDDTAVKQVITTPPTTDGDDPPIQVVQDDRANGTLDVFEVARDGSGAPTSTVTSRTQTSFNEQQQVVSVDRYRDTVSLSYNPGTGALTGTDFFYRTTYGYDARGRQERAAAGSGFSGADPTITRTVYDGLNRPIQTWVGTDDTGWSPGSPGTNMTLVSENQYDGGSIANGDIGDSNLTQVTQIPDSGDSSKNRVTVMRYDWRNRLVLTKQGVEGSESESVNRPIIYCKYDNLDRCVMQYIFDGDTVAVDGLTNGVPNQPDAARMRSAALTQYDDRGRVFRTSVFSVDQSSGVSGDIATNTAAQFAVLSASAIATLGGLRTDNWYDHRDNLIKTKQPGGLVTKMSYDGAGRLVKQSITDGDGDPLPGVTGNWAAAGSLTDDAVLEQVLNFYDDNGNVLLIVQKQRDHDTTATADLNKDNSRISTVAKWYDAANRLTTSINFGNNGDDSSAFGSGDSYTRPSLASYDRDATTGNSDPMATDGFDRWLRTDQQYDAHGRPAISIDPRGIATRTYYDSLSRVIGMTEAYSGSLSNMSPDADPDPGEDTDRKTLHEFNGFDQKTLETSITYDPAAPTTPREHNTTYTYGVTKAGGSLINHSGLLDTITYDLVPDDPAEELPSLSGLTSDDALFGRYNALGELIERTDRNGTIHSYTFDVVGRQTSDEWTATETFANGFISTWADERQVAYDALGRGVLFTMLDSSTPVNQVQRVFDGLGNLVVEYQEHNGAVNTGSSAKVEYTFDTDFTDNLSRLITLIYPSLGRELTYVYQYDGAADSTTNFQADLNNAISRVGKVEDLTYTGGETPGEQNAYMGLSTVVLRRYQDVRRSPTAFQTMELNYYDVGLNSSFTLFMPDDAGTDDPYFGLDRFGRVVAQEWFAFGDDYELGYDANSNLLYARNVQGNDYTKWRSQIYHAQGASAFTAYDQLNRMQEFHRGEMDPTDKTTVDASGLSDVRETDTEYGVTVGGFHDVATTNPEPINRGRIYQRELTNPTTPRDFGGFIDPSAYRRDYFLTYDAWGQLVKQTAASPVYAGTGNNYTYDRLYTNEFVYDALGRRIQEIETNRNNVVKVTELYYDASGAVIEENDDTSRTRQYFMSAASPGMMFAQYDSDLPANEDLIWVAQGPDGSVWSLAQHEDIGLGSTVGTYLVYAPTGQATFLNVTGVSTWTLTEIPFIDFRYTWHGGRMVNDQDLNFAGLAVVDRQSGLLLMPSGALYDSTTGTPLNQDKYAFFRPSTGMGELAVNANQLSSRSAYVVNFGYNGTAPYWQAEEQFQQMAVQRQAMMIGIIGGAVAGGAVGGVLGMLGTTSMLTLGMASGFAAGTVGSFAGSYGTGQSAGQIALNTSVGGVAGLIGGAVGGGVFGAMGSTFRSALISGAAGGVAGGGFYGGYEGYMDTGTFGGTLRGAGYGALYGGVLGGATAGATYGVVAGLRSLPRLSGWLVGPKSGLSAGTQRAAQYGSGWQRASLGKAIQRHAGLNATSWRTATGKTIYENPLTGRQVVIDEAGGYFRIFQPNTIGGTRGTYLNLMGKAVTPAMRTGGGVIKSVNLRDVDTAAWQRETHFLY